VDSLSTNVAPHKGKQPAHLFTRDTVTKASLPNQPANQPANQSGGAPGTATPAGGMTGPHDDRHHTDNTSGATPGSGTPSNNPPHIPATAIRVMRANPRRNRQHREHRRPKPRRTTKRAIVAIAIRLRRARPPRQMVRRRPIRRRPSIATVPQRRRRETTHLRRAAKRRRRTRIACRKALRRRIRIRRTRTRRRKTRNRNPTKPRRRNNGVRSASVAAPVFICFGKQGRARTPAVRRQELSRSVFNRMAMLTGMRTKPRAGACFVHASSTDIVTAWGWPMPMATPCSRARASSAAIC
jgi:hypothetical protein